MFRLEFPNTSHKKEYLAIMEEWSPSSPGALFRGESFEEFLQLAIDDLEKGNRHGVPATLYFLVNTEDRILGAIQIRHHINHPKLIEMGGHIGYGMRPSERGKGYAKEMLKLALIESKKLGLDRVLITCDDENIPSYKVIEANCGIFERYGEREDGGKGRRYWIDLYSEEKTVLQSLEIELLQYATRHNPARLDALLADDFFECGKTGDMFGKKECLASLPDEDKKKTFECRDMSVHMLSENVGQVRFICTIQNPGESLTTSFRTSLWRRSESGWQMFFHQGTLLIPK